ncbi:MAG: hypothetical protein ACOVOI_09985 [Hyphomicrobiales bacterium]
MTLILWQGGDPFADEWTLEAGASVRCSGGNRAGDHGRIGHPAGHEKTRRREPAGLIVCRGCGVRCS